MRIGRVVMVVVILLSFSSLALAMTNEEKLEKLEEKFLNGEISEELFKRLEKKYKGETAPTIPTLATAPKVEGNLVTNGNFETPDPANPSKPLGWHQGNEHCQWVDGGRNGGKCVRLEPESYVNYFYGWFCPIEVKPHTKYKVSLWVKSENADSVPKLIFNKSFGKWDINLPQSSDWTEFKTIIDSGTAQGWSWCPIKKFKGKPYVALAYFGKAGAVYLDDLSIIELKK